MKNLFLANDSNHATSLMFEDGGCLIRSKRSAEIRQLTLDVISDFEKLVALNKEARSKWEIIAEDQTCPDDGLIEKNGGVFDHKFFFHYKDERRMFDHLKNNLPDFGKWEIFLRKSDKLHKILNEEMSIFLEAFNKKYPEYDLLQKVISQPKEDRGVLRLLYYKPGHELMAQHHFDQSLFTFHVADSHPGLVFDANERDIYHPENNNLLIFPGMKAEIATKSFFKARLHGVVKNGLSPDRGRWSVVFFFHCCVGKSSNEMSQIVKRESKIALQKLGK